MAKEVIMPKAGMAMEEGTIVKWFKKEGDPVEKGEPLLEILTDKVNMEIEALYSGVLLKILKDEGEVVPVTQPIAYIGEPGENIDDLLAAAGKEKDEVAEEPKDTPQKTETDGEAKLEKSGGKIPATPLAKTLAKEMGIDLSTLQGSGSFGQILARDVKEAKPLATPLAKRIAEDRGIDLSTVQGSGHRGKVTKADLPLEQEAVEAAERVPMAGMRKVIAERMHMSYTQSPHVTLNAKADVTELAELRKKMNAASETKISYNDFVLRAVAMALRQHPFMNVSIEGDDLVYHRDIHLGMAVALEEGLIVPVIRKADELSVREISAQAKELAAKAREGKLLPDEYSGGTFTVSNLGMYGILSFNPIINPPESAILGVCAIQEELKMVEEKIEKRLYMGLSLSFDHRAMDGAQGAIFLKTLIDLLENPYGLIG